MEYLRIIKNDIGWRAIETMFNCHSLLATKPITIINNFDHCTIINRSNYGDKKKTNIDFWVKFQFLYEIFEKVKKKFKCKFNHISHIFVTFFQIFNIKKLKKKHE
jgi:hypothetical protein